MLRHELKEHIGEQALNLANIWIAIVTLIIAVLVLSYFVAR